MRKSGAISLDNHKRMCSSEKLIISLVDSFQEYQQSLINCKYDHALEVTKKSSAAIENFKSKSRNQCTNQDQMNVLFSMEAGFKLFKTLAELEVKQISIPDVDMNQIKSLVIQVYKSKIFLGMFRLICENFTTLFLRAGYFKTARVFLLLTLQYYDDLETNDCKEKTFFASIGIGIETSGKDAARIKSELMYMMDLFDLSQIYYSRNIELSPDIIANESIFDGLLSEMKIKNCTYPIPIIVKTPTQAEALFNQINKKLTTMKLSYDKMDQNDPVSKMFNTKEQGQMWCKFWLGLIHKFKCAFVDIPQKLELLEKCLEHWTELRQEKFMSKEIAPEHQVLYTRCLRELISYYDCQIFVKLETIKNKLKKDALEVIQQINDIQLNSIEIALELLKFSEKHSDFLHEKLTMLLHLATAYRNMIVPSKKKSLKYSNKSTMYLNKAVKLLKDTDLPPWMPVCIHEINCLPCRALLDVQTKEESCNLLISQIENTWYLKKFRDPTGENSSDDKIFNAYAMLNRFEESVEAIIDLFSCSYQDQSCWDPVNVLVSESLNEYAKFKLQKLEIDKFAQEQLQSMENHFQLLEMVVEVRLEKCSLEDLNIPKLKKLILEGFKHKVEFCFFLACEKLVHLLIEMNHFRMSRVLLMVLVDIKREGIKQFGAKKTDISNMIHRCLCIQVQFVSYYFLYACRSLRNKSNSEYFKVDDDFESQLDDLFDSLSLKDNYASIPKKIKTFADVEKLNKALNVHLDLVEKSMQDVDDSPDLLMFKKESMIYIRYWKALQFKEMSTFKENESIAIDLIEKSLKAFDTLKRDHFKMSDIRMDQNNSILVGKTESIYGNLLACNVSNYVKLYNYNKIVLLQKSEGKLTPSLSTMLRDHNALTKDAIVCLKEYLSFLNTPSESNVSCKIIVEAYYFIAHMYRSNIETNSDKHLRNMNNSLPYIKKIVEMIDKNPSGEAYEWLCTMMMQSTTELKFLLLNNMTMAKREQLLVDEIDRDQFISHFRYL